MIAENKRLGSTDWIIRHLGSGSKGPPIEGYTDHVSVQRGDELVLYVNTAARHGRAYIYRMGFYQGHGARLVHASPELAGSVQPAPSFTPGINMVECHWHASRSFSVADDWLPGAYLIKLVASSGAARYVPFTVRDDNSNAAIVIQSSVTTWQAYNLWGGYSLYGGNPIGHQSDYQSRSRIVSFDRPYGHPPLDAHGSGDFLGNEYPLIYLAERHGLNVTYATDIDLHARPELLLRHRCLVSLGHDEYWSAEMRDGATAALARGVNLAFLGANAVYRQIRLEASQLGANRRVICYKDAAEDPILARDPALATAASWAQGPDPRPESELIGLMYQSYGADGDLNIVDANSWILAGTGLQNGQRLKGIVGSEFDGFEPGLPGPRNVEILAHSSVKSVSGKGFSDMSYYTRPGGGGVFASGTAALVSSLWHALPPLPNLLGFAVQPSAKPLSTLVLNVLEAFSSGPASARHPSSANWRRFYSPNARVQLGVEA